MVPVPISTSPSRAATEKPPPPPVRAISGRVAPLSPRPGESSETASSTLVLPAPFSPVSTTRPGPGASKASR